MGQNPDEIEPVEQLVDKLEKWAERVEPKLPEHIGHISFYGSLKKALDNLPDLAFTWLQSRMPEQLELIRKDFDGLYEKARDVDRQRSGSPSASANILKCQAQAAAKKLAQKLRLIVKMTKENLAPEKQPETKQDIKAVKESKSKSLVTESQSARTTALLAAVRDLTQIADNFESWADKEHDRFRRAVSADKVEWWISNHFSNAWIAGLFNYPVPRQPNGLFPNGSKKEFRLTMDTFLLYMPNIARSLGDLYDMFLRSIKFHTEMYERAKRGELPLLSMACTNFLATTVPETVRRLRYIAEMVREELASEKPTETEPDTTPAKRQRTKRIIGWIFKGFIALTLLLICLYVFGVVTGIFIFASVLTCLHLLGYLEQFNTLIDKILQLK